MSTLDQMLSQSSALHSHLCPRQVLGVCMGMLAGERYYRLAEPEGKRRFALIQLPVEAQRMAVSALFRGNGATSPADLPRPGSLRSDGPPDHMHRKTI